MSSSASSGDGVPGSNFDQLFFFLLSFLATFASSGKHAGEVVNGSRTLGRVASTRMGVIKYRSKYPVIHQGPGLGLLLSNMNVKDWGIFAGLTALSFPVGYMCGGVSSKVRVPMMWFTVACGSAAGLAAGILRSSGRLMGLTANQSESKYYKYRLDFPDYQVRTEPFRTLIEEELQEIQDNPRY